MTIRVILCDLDGTLVDSQRDIARAFQQAWGQIIGAIPPPEAAIARHIGKPLAHMAQALGAVLTPDLAQAFVSTYRQCYADLNARQTQIYPGVMTTLQTLSTYTFGIVTTKDQSQAEFVLRRLALLPFFQHVEGGSSGLPLKPAPDTVLAALAALRCPPDQALMVGDTPADILAGKAAGTRTCAVTYGFGSRADLLHCAPDALVDHFGEVYRLVRAINGSRAAGLPASSGEV